MRLNPVNQFALLPALIDCRRHVDVIFGVLLSMAFEDAKRCVTLVEVMGFVFVGVVSVHSSQVVPPKTHNFDRMREIIEI
jgi:NADH:ubiquinone oxidoreductase subunit 4 (subunit M)